MKHFSKYLDSTPMVHEQTKVQHRIQNIENKHKIATQKQNQGDKIKNIK
jgi:hypothetical protein